MLKNLSVETSGRHVTAKWGKVCPRPQLPLMTFLAFMLVEGGVCVDVPGGCIQCHRDARSNAEMSNEGLLRGLKIAQDNAAPEGSIQLSKMRAVLVSRWSLQHL